jgi:gamma-glutamyl:cysteine ligase YbdK (ATP-grasp superfamily)
MPSDGAPGYPRLLDSWAMAKLDITAGGDRAEMRRFVRALLEDIHALERMIDRGMIETGVRRIGAEQEMFLVDRSLRPKNSALAILKRVAGGPFTTELGQFNLEANLQPRELARDCLSAMEGELNDCVARVRRAAAEEDTRIVLCGILPTLDKTHLGLDSMTPIPRYHQLNQILIGLRGGHFTTLIKGVDELKTTHDNVMLEACNTSFQLHYQVGPAEFAKLYNLAQVITAPVLAAAVNSPVLLRHRLWHETRVALFQQSLDTRSDTMAQRGTRQRVSFGDRWVRDSILEIFRDDVARFRSLIAGDSEESPLAMVDRGEAPPLTSLRLHNGTVYRWNRPCYGVNQGKAHLRIENRVMPAGPTVVDEIANAAFYFGLMSSLEHEYGDVTKLMSFDDAKANFFAAARYGLQARVRWIHGKSYGVDDLILNHLLPLARAGLEGRELAASDIDRYLGVFTERVQSGRTGSQWALDSLASMGDQGRAADRHRALVATMATQQEAGAPVSTWPLAKVEEETMSRDDYATIGQVMTTDLFTVHPRTPSISPRA